MNASADRERVPVRTILAAIGLVLATGLLLLFLRAAAEVLSWMGVALFFAVAVYPVVNWVEARARWIPRSLATLLVYLLVLLVLGGLMSLFVIPIVRQGPQLADSLPGMVADARHGRGPMGSLITRFNIDDYLREHQDQLQGYVSGLGAPALGVLRGLVSGVVAVATIFVLSYLMVLQAPRIIDAALAAAPHRHAERARRVGSASARIITGYLSGNLLISVIAGLLTYGVLLVMHVPFAALIALFVAVTDLIPLVGATLGAVVAIGAAFLHSTTAGIVVTVFCIVYQQAENHLLQPVIMSRTVNINPLVVLVAVLIGVALAGLLGALLAIPVAGVIQVVLQDLWDAHRGRLDDANAAVPAD
ncbi:AI-2E family transporter [Actinoplanes sp. NPDC026623]|uniref:AI-2E family transporter n=1 Tax=Actinoplanes sp. NPDC026623 TaxID=3155610 RepID=UPI0033D5AC89